METQNGDPRSASRCRCGGGTGTRPGGRRSARPDGGRAAQARRPLVRGGAAAADSAGAARRHPCCGGTPAGRRQLAGDRDARPRLRGSQASTATIRRRGAIPAIGRTARAASRCRSRAEYDSAARISAPAPSSGAATANLFFFFFFFFWGGGGRGPLRNTPGRAGRRDHHLHGAGRAGPPLRADGDALPACGGGNQLPGRQYQPM